MLLSSVQVLLEIEHDSVIKRWLSFALVPLGEHPSTIDVSGEVVIAESERKTRSSKCRFVANSDVEGKVCFCESFDERSAGDAVLFSNKAGARALLVAHEPDVAVTMPTIIMSQEHSKYLKDLPAAMVSALYISGSYEVINVTLTIQRMSTESDSPFKWKSKMSVPTSMIEKVVSDLEFKMLIGAPFYRDDRSKDINSFVSSEDISGKICLVDANYPGDPDRAVELATECGASALFICGKENPGWSKLTLPAVAIDGKQCEALKKAGLGSGDLGVIISYDKDVTFAEKNKSPSSQPRRRVDPPFGLASSIKEEFDAIVRDGTSWSYDGPNHTSFRNAMRILDRVRNLGSLDEQRDEVSLLIETICDMTEKRDFAGDVRVILFCAHLISLKEQLGIDVSASELEDAMVTMVNGIIVDPEVLKLQGTREQKLLDGCIVRLTKRISDRSLTKNKHVKFVLNALWARSYHCNALRNGKWVDLERVTSLKHMIGQKEIILSFMDPIKFNTLLITSIAHDLADIYRVFDGDDVVPILDVALRKLQVMYERNSLTRQMWIEKRGSSRELSMLNLIRRLVVKNGNDNSKREITRSVIKGASFESIGSFQELDILYSSLEVDHRNYNMITWLIKNSIFESLENRWKSPSPRDVSSLLSAELGLLLANRTGWNKLMSFAKKNPNKDGFELFSHIYDLMIRQHEWTEDHKIIDDLIGAISHCISSSNRLHSFAVTAFQVASSGHGIFTCPGEESKSICPRLGELIVSKTGLASSIRRDPSLLYDVPSFELDSSVGISLINCLVRELILQLKMQCSKIEDAVSFYMNAKPFLAPMAVLKNVASDIILNSFSNWSPSSLDALLQVNDSTLVHVHNILNGLPEGDNAKGKKCALVIESIILSWLSTYDTENFDARYLGEVSSVLTEEKRNALIKISGRVFPTKNELYGAISLIKTMNEAIHSMLTIQSSTDDTSSYTHSILELATAFRVCPDSIPKYLCGNNSPMSLADLRRDRDATDSFLHKHGCSLHAAAYFLENKSVLFQHGIGTWLDIRIEEFLAKIASTLEHLVTLFSPNATYSVISKAAKVVEEESVCVENELRSISSFPRLDIDKNTSLACIVTLATMSELLQKFVDCCETHKFMFVKSDNNFSTLACLSETLLGEDGLDLCVDECHKMGFRIAEILSPNSASLDLGQRLKMCLPVLQFFDTLRYCNSVFSLAKKRMWLGEEGLQTFYKEWTNISNIFQSNKSFENEVLDRLEPSVRALSVVGGALGCCSVANLLDMLQDNADILKLDEMRLVQDNILKVQDWFSEGMDDMATILSKFALIQLSGSFVIHSTTSIGSPVPKRSIVLRYSRSQTTDDEFVTMVDDDIKEFVQFLGFVNHDSDATTKSAAIFIDTYSQLCQIMENQQAMIDVGFNDTFSPSTMEYALHTSKSQFAVAEWLDEARDKLTQCNTWIKGVRSYFRYSLLFWVDELQQIFQWMSETRTMYVGCDAIIATEELEPVRKILDAMSRLSPDILYYSECLNIILEHINESQSADTSWLEDVSNLVNKCGEFSERLNLSCFQAVEPKCHKQIVIHKPNCVEDMVFAAPLHLLRHIYKSRRPASFEVLDGACIQSPDEIQLFLDRVLAFPDQTFTIVSVDELPANEQEIIANFLAKHSRSADKMHLHCIQLRDTILHAPPGIEIRLWDDSSFDDDQHIAWLKNHVVSERHFNSITIVCGSSGSGKTRHIREEMENLATSKRAKVASMYIHEDFTLSKAIASLRTKFKCGPSQNRAIHFGFSLGSTKNPPKDLMLSVNNFFNSFLVLQTIYDPSPGSGNCFHSGMHSYMIFIECTGNESICRTWLRRYVPILTCCNGIIQPPPNYIVDHQTRRVCTYLRAYDECYDDGTRKIDRKFNPTPCNKRIMFVLDKSESMEVDLGGRTSLEVATDCMLTIFDSHLQLMDHIGLIRFNHEFEELIPLQRVDNDLQRGHLRGIMNDARHNPRGSTSMFTALSQAVDLLGSNSDADGDAWIICLTDGQSWDSNEHLRQQLQNSSNNLHLVVIGVNLDENINDAMEQLCDKYHSGRNLRNKGFFLPTSANMIAIEKAFDQVASRIPVSQTFELDGIMSEVECRAKLEEHRPDFIDPKNKLLFRFWVNFLFRRVSVFDQNEDFNYNEEQDSLGSSLMEVMLSESRQMLRREQNCSWNSSNHTQLIYDFSQQDSPQFRLICTSPDNLDGQQRKNLQQLKLPGFTIPTTAELRKRHTLDRYLSQALCIPLNEGQDGRESLQCIDDNKFVLTLDFTLKLLNIHERVSCGVPCLMEGETGVSKTALTKMYSILVNSQQNSVASASTMATLKSIVHELTERFSAVVLDEDSICGTTGQIRKFLESSQAHSVEEASQVIRGLINEACSNRNAMFASMPPSLIDNVDEDSVSELLDWFSSSHLEQTFFDINIDPTLSADDIKCRLDEARRIARKISSMDIKVVVFLDEINTSSVLGLLKEVIVDRSFNGDLLEENIVVIAACNPVRESTVTQAKSSREIDLGREWVSGHYQVKKLPTSLGFISWDFGSLNSEQEKEFIHQRITMMGEKIPSVMARAMTEVISSSHELIRTLAEKHIAQKITRGSEGEAKLRARSVVSLRDIQRVFHLLGFFLHDFSFGLQLSCELPQKFRRAMLLSVGIVYYLRLDTLARSEFLQKLKSLPSEQYQEFHLKEVLDSAIDKLMEHTEIPVGIALTSGLKENTFMTLVCTLSRTPLMIVGPPGCSKTLAVSIVTDNANGEESPALFYRKFARVQPFHYQCSKSSTSNEVASVFDRAIQRQSKVTNSAPMQCLVFMDEAGLPEEEKESLKVLHYLLEGHMSASPEVGFVCITNHILDAAKSNRCVCLMRPEPDKEELMCIAMGVLCQKHQSDESNVQFICFEMRMMTAEEFSSIMCNCYLNLIQNKVQFRWFVQFFGLRDFLHALRFIRRNASLRESVLNISVEILLNALERNFNGVNNENFSNMCASFLANFMTDKRRIEENLNKFLRHPMTILRNSLSEIHPNNASRYNLPRYKMIIDNTNDNSVMRLLRMSGILDSSHSFYMLSGMKDGSEMEQLNLISRVKYSAQQGTSVVMSQVEEISECFYDLFNQHFSEFSKDGQVSYFANIAIGGISRPCIIHPSFQCIVHVESNQLDDIPAPFLNRFEKFQLNVDDILSWQLSRLPPGINGILSDVLLECEELLSHMGNGSIWSTSPNQTLKSLFISMIPPDIDGSHVSQCIGHGYANQPIRSSVLAFLKRWLIVDISIEDIDQSIATASIELRGLDSVWLRKVEDVEGRLDQIQLEKSFRDLAIGEQLDSSISCSLKKIVHYVLLRHVIFRLLLVAMPEAVFLQRENLPREALRAYFGGSQEHFNLKSLISKISQGNSQLYMLHVRSDSCAHSLPTWCGEDERPMKSPEEAIFKQIVQSIIHENPSRVEIRHLDLLKSESSLRNTIESWALKQKVDSLILVVNMQLHCSSNLVNYIRTHVEQMDLQPTKKFLLLLHYPLSCKPSYPALFLGNWQCAYLDGIGYRSASSSHLSTNNIFEAACFDCDLNADSLLDALLPKAIQYIASQVSFYSCSSHPQSVNQHLQFTERLVKIEAVLMRQIKGKSLGKHLMEKYLANWTKEAINEMLHHSAIGLKSGTTHLSLSTAVRSTFQHTFNKFLAISILNMNTWSNLDILLTESCSDSDTDEIFSFVMSALPGTPWKELLLHRDVYCHLNPLPLEMAHSKALVLFPFYYQVSSFIDMALDKAYGGSIENDSRTDLNADFFNMMEKADEIFSILLENSSTASQPIDESMITMVQGVIKAVEASAGLYEKYLTHMLLWKFGIRNVAQVTWVLNKINIVSSSKLCNRNIVVLHVVCRMNVIDIIRMASWDAIAASAGHQKGDFSTEEAKFEGPLFVGTMLRYFKSSFADSVDVVEWSHSFSVFMQSIPTIIGDRKQLDEKSTIVLRQLVFLSIIINVNAPEAVVSQMAEQINKEEIEQSRYSLHDFFQFLDGNSVDSGLDWFVDAKEKLLRILFSPSWLTSISDIDQADASFLLDLIKERRIEHQMAVVHLRNLLMSSANDDRNKTQFILPTKCFSQSIALLTCRSLTCQVSDFCKESKKRKLMPHYIPSWLRGDSQPAINNGIDDDIYWFLRSYRNAFDCQLADAIFDIMMGILLDRVRSSNSTSEQLLILLQQTIYHEREFSQIDHIRRAKQVLQPDQQATVSFVGSCLGAIEADALLICLVCKIAEELSTTSQASALCGIYSHLATDVLDNIMVLPKWPDLFFSVIVRLRGEGHLASLLNEGGVLDNFDWCEPWKQGISLLRHDIMADLTEAENNLRNAQRDVMQFHQHYRACPHCRGLFGVDQRNCGQFTCGRDAHGVGGGPAVGGQAVRETFGCGQTFSIDQSLPYNQSRQHTEDQAALQQLSGEYERKKNIFDEFNNGAALRMRATQFDVPSMSFHVRRELLDGIFPSANLIDIMPEEESNPGTRLLIGILDYLPNLEHLSYLPYMVEFYVFVHKTFRHMVTKEQAMNTKVENIMDEHLLTNRFGSIDCANLQHVWSKVVKGVNAFLDANDSVVNWNCEEVNVPFRDITTCSLMSILSEMEHPTEGHDYLFLIINELVLRYNNFVKSVGAITNSDNGELYEEEIHPRTLVGASKGSIIVNCAVSNTQSLIDNLVESYWMKEERNFNTESLTKAISYDMEMIGRLPPIKAPLIFLRERFDFRGCSLSIINSEDTSDACFCSTDGRFFARHEDLSLYEEVKESAMKHGFSQGNSNIRHTMVVTFQNFSHDAWTNLLEGLRNILGHLQRSEFLRGDAQFGRAVINASAIPTLQAVGFPALDGTQSNFLNSITKNEVLEFISVCGEQLSSEAYRFVGIPSRLAEPLQKDTTDAVREGIMRLLISKSIHDVLVELDTFCDDVLEFYCERMIVPASESSNEGLSVFLKRNNCCDESDDIFSAIPRSITIRNYIDVQKVLYQAKLRLVFDSQKSDDSNCGEHVAAPTLVVRKYSNWRPMGQDEVTDKINRKYCWKAVGNLWFEDALFKCGIGSEGGDVESEGTDDLIGLEENKNDTCIDDSECACVSAADKSDVVAAISPQSTELDKLIEDVLTEQGVETTELGDAARVNDTPTERQMNAPISIEKKLEEEIKGSKIDYDATDCHHKSDEGVNHPCSSIWLFVLGVVPVLLGIILGIALVSFARPLAYKQNSSH